MSPSTPPPSKAGIPPSGGNGKYIAVAVVLLLGMGGLAYWKLGQSPPPPPPPIPTASVATTATGNPKIDDVPPPPPVEDAGPDVGAPKGPTGPGPNPCEVTVCNGKPTPDTEAALAMLARQSRKKCYETALAQDPELQGHVDLSVKIAGNGQLCSVGVSSSTMSIPSVGDCTARTIAAGGRVPAPTGGCVNIKFPVNYKPAGK
jgi:hypothetical protein